MTVLALHYRRCDGVQADGTLDYGQYGLYDGGESLECAWHWRTANALCVGVVVGKLTKSENER